MEIEELKDFFYKQLSTWEMAAENHTSLRNIERKWFKLSDLEGYVQYNPKRAISTLANVDKNIIEQRRCFLCKDNRPLEQKSIEILPDWELLVNPFPILPYHFTIACKSHTPQILDLNIGKKLALELKGMVVFFNGDGAGASAPDHVHFQVVPIEEMPLINLLENNKKDKLSLPYPIIKDEVRISKIKKPVNAFFWKSMKKDEVNVIVVERTAHRPKEFYLPSPHRRAFSPGAIDIAGIFVTPYREDFEKITINEIENIYHQVTTGE